MTPAELITLAQKASIFLTVCALGIRAEPQDATYLLRQPSLLLRSLLSMNIVMPVCAVAFAWALNLKPAVEVALVTLAVSPVPPTLPKKQIKAGGGASYAIGLLVVQAVLAIVFVPAVVPVVGRVFHIAVRIHATAVAMLILETVLAPLVVGMLVSRFAPDTAKRTAGPVALVATLLLIVSMAAIVLTAGSGIVSLLGSGTIVAIAAFSALGLAVGHLLGGPHPEGRAVLALSSATRHPGVAMAIASANLTDPRMVQAAILLFNIVGGVVAAPYLRRITPRIAQSAAEPM